MLTAVPTTQPTATIAADEIGFRAESGVPLSKIEVVNDRGRLNFANLDEFIQAVVSVSEATEAEISAWHDELGFVSLQSTFNDWQTGLPDELSSLSVKIPTYVHERGEGDYVPNSYSVILDRIANEEG